MDWGDLYPARPPETLLEGFRLLERKEFKDRQCLSGVSDIKVRKSIYSPDVRAGQLEGELHPEFGSLSFIDSC